jgi:TctA family transporter
MVLGSLAERNYHQSMLMSDDSWGIFVSRTASLILLVCIVLSLLSPALRPMFKRFSARRLAARAHSRKVDRVIGSENALEQKSGPP